MDRPLSEPPYSRPCPDCAEGTVWLSPDGHPAAFCPEHESIVAHQPGWRRAPYPTRQRTRDEVAALMERVRARTTGVPDTEIDTMVRRLRDGDEED